MRGVADPHRLCAFVAGQPCGLPFQQATLAHDAVHDLHVGGRTRRRPQQPAVPGGGFLGVAGVHQRQQREGGVAQPAEAIIPVSGAAELFRQRGRWRGDDAAGRGVSLRLQRDQRAHHEVAVLALISAATAPFGPERFGVLQRIGRIDRLGHGQMRGAVGEHEGNGVALADLEIGDRRQVLAAGLDRRPQHRHVLPADREQRRTVLAFLDPGNIGAEAEADHQLHVHLDPAANAAHQPHHVGGVAARRHEIDQVNRAVSRLEPGLKDQGVIPIAARGAGNFPAGAISQRPCFSVPRSAAKQASESKAGQHSQSIDPFRPTSAAVSQSPISP